MRYDTAASSGAVANVKVSRMLLEELDFLAVSAGHSFSRVGFQIPASEILDPLVM